MCGRFSYTPEIDAAALIDLFRLARIYPDIVPRYNIAPTQPVAAVLQMGGERRLDMLRWGLIPWWSKDQKIGSRLINARSESVWEKPSFRDCARSRRCLVIADGFYEWRRTEGGKTPYRAHLPGVATFAFAGLWDSWRSPDGRSIKTCTILTTTPNELLRPIHDRMPVILPPTAYDRWLDPGQSERDDLEDLCVPFPAAHMAAYPVASVVNSPANDVADCVEPVGPALAPGDEDA